MPLVEFTLGAPDSGEVILLKDLQSELILFPSLDALGIITSTRQS